MASSLVTIICEKTYPGEQTIHVRAKGPAASSEVASVLCAAELDCGIVPSGVQIVEDGDTKTYMVTLPDEYVEKVAKALAPWMIEDTAGDLLLATQFSLQEMDLSSIRCT